MNNEEAKMYMNPPTRDVATLEDWFPYTQADGLIEVEFDDDYGWIEL